MKRTHIRLARTTRSARLASVASAALLLALVGGCASRSPNLDAQFGKSVRLLNAQQTINPNAAANTDPVMGLDGKAALSGYGDYQKTFAAPVPQPATFTIGIGK
jgi:hypothetical protein